LFVDVGINHCHQATFNQANGIPPFFWVFETVVETFESRPVKYLDRVLKRDSVDAQVPRGLLYIPSVSHRVHLHNVFTESRWGKTGSRDPRPLKPGSVVRIMTSQHVKVARKGRGAGHRKAIALLGVFGYVLADMPDRLVPVPVQ